MRSRENLLRYIDKVWLFSTTVQNQYIDNSIRLIMAILVNA